MTKLILIDIAISVTAVLLMVWLSNLDVIWLKFKRFGNGVVFKCEQLGEYAKRREAPPLFADEALKEIKRKRGNPY